MADATLTPATQAATSAGARRDASTGPVVLQTRHLVKRYGERLAVNDLNLQVFRGDIFGFLGPNGAGKTTTIRTALGLITPTEGSVEIFGQDVRTHRAQVLPRVGALIEQPALYTYLSGHDNLQAVGDALGGVSEQRIQATLQTVGLAGRQKDRVKTYSLGMKQRLGVGIALLNDPDLLVLDEPANGLDPAGIVEMRDLMRNLSAQGKTIFISSHVLGEVRQICTRVAILNLGKLITEATVEDLTKSHGEFAAQVERPQEALAIVQAQPWGKSARLDTASGALITPAPNGNGRDLNLFLVNLGFVPASLVPQTQDLESVFLELTDNIAGDAR